MYNMGIYIARLALVISQHGKNTYPTKVSQIKMELAHHHNVHFPLYCIYVADYPVFLPTRKETVQSTSEKLGENQINLCIIHTYGHCSFFFPQCPTRPSESLPLPYNTTHIVRSGGTYLFSSTKGDSHASCHFPYLAPKLTDLIYVHTGYFFSSDADDRRVSDEEEEEKHEKN